jgi:hypothetical protein
MSVSLKLYRGDSFPVELAMLTTGSAVFDLTGYSAKVSLRWPQCQTVSLASSDGDLTIDSTAGTITGTFAEADTKCLPDSADYYVVLTTTADVKQTYHLGRVKVMACNSSIEDCCE